MVFADVDRTQLTQVLTLHSVQQVAYIVGESTQVVSNYFHHKTRAHKVGGGLWLRF